jgi:CBS domain containing-hemolysin-like protein
MRIPRRLPVALLTATLLFPIAARASFLPPEMMDTAATVLAWIVIFVAPVIAIGLFLVVHVLPEKIAEHNHHPQQNAIKTLCFLSLVFGGLLWPLAWLWAFTRPVAFRAAYGTEKHEHYFTEMGARAARGELDQLELEHLRDELVEMASRGPLPKALRDLPALVAQARPKSPEQTAAGAQPAPAAGGAH